MFGDPQVKHLAPFYGLSHPEGGDLAAIPCPVRSDGRRDGQSTKAAPMLGEHAGEILANFGI